MADARDLVTASLVDLGVLAAGETAQAGDATFALETLNRLMNQWAAEKLQSYTLTRTMWSITANDGDYTVGSGANVNVARPVHVDDVRFIDTSTDPDTEHPMDKLTEEAYAAISQKALTSVYPSKWYYNPTYPNGTLNLWPVPTSATLQGALYAWAVLGTFASLSTSVSLPPAYERMIVKNLAIELAPSYERSPNPLLIEQARDSKAAVKRSNSRLQDLSFDRGSLIQGGGPGGYSIYTDR